MKIIILGPPGTGKGTQAKIIAKEYGLKHLSTGELFRQEIAKKSKIGMEVQKYTESGSLAPLQVTMQVMKENLPADNFILDGFPRSLEQAKELDKFVKADYILNIDSDKKLLIKRLLGRAEKEGRKDDTPEVIENRFKVYEQQTKPLLDFYSSRITNIDGNGNPEDIFKNIKKVLGKK